MCDAFSCIVLDSGKVLWKFGIDSHADILTAFGMPDKELPAKFAKVEISPSNRSYLYPDKWVFRIDEDTKPAWWHDEYEADARKALAKWKRKLYRILVCKPIIHPFNDRKPPKITKKHLEFLKEWNSVEDSVWRTSLAASVEASVRASVGDSVWASVVDSVRASVGDSVWASVVASLAASVEASVRRTSVGDSVWRTSLAASVRDSVGDSVLAYAGTFFKLSRKNWKYTEKIKTKGYPFQPSVDLWEMGIVPVFDGTEWMLLGGNDAHILWKGVI
jgi:hypothetical protein